MFVAGNDGSFFLEWGQVPGGGTDLKLARGFGLQAEVFFSRAVGSTHGGLETAATPDRLKFPPDRSALASTALRQAVLLRQMQSSNASRDQSMADPGEADLLQQPLQLLGLKKLPDRP